MQTANFTWHLQINKSLNVTSELGWYLNDIQLQYVWGNKIKIKFYFLYFKNLNPRFPSNILWKAVQQQQIIH